ncbi:T-complex protein 1 subunit beta-like [Populus alba x Populus x berolinensis]|uniref:CCT-beta n=2 Tax=Populus TaxID=3689 RepID=A0AAD6QN35_9ROSI|nr:T-complex protein 1 subunit beta-like [Populus alba x Populus x berolinensis]
MAVADLVKTTLGPKGMDKILQSTGRGHEVTVTNDGATILKSLHIDNPAAKILVDISKVQDDEVGDGTTSVVVLAGELLREAEKLLAAKIHPMTIIAGFRMAAECARNALLQKVLDNKDNAEKFMADLMKIARTTLSSKILSQDKEYFAKLAVDAVMRLQGSTNLEAIQIIKKPGGSLKDSFLDEGFILDKKIGVGQPKRIENAKILVANTAMDTDKVKIYGARVRVDSMSRVAEIEAAEKQKMKEKVDKIIAHGINCFINRQLIYNFPEELFANAGILAIEHADFDGIERLALVTGGEIASTFDNPESVKLGHCKLIEEIMIGEDKLIHFSGVEMGQACTIVLRGASHHVLDEAERSLHDALCVLSQTVNDSRVLLGGGWPEMVMAKEVDELARVTPGKKSHAIEAFSRALITIPTIIAENAGLDSAELVAQLRAEHHKEGCTSGIDVISGSIGDMVELGISEAFKVKQAVLLSATEAAEMILRVDEIITCAPRRREDRIMKFFLCGSSCFSSGSKATIINDRSSLPVEVESMRGEREFISEIAALSDIKHENLVTLRGCCVDGAKRYLVYDYMENNSLVHTLLEYAVSGHMTRKSDVYSFGVLLLEIISGRPVVDFDLEHGEHYLVQMAWEAYKGNSLLQIVDPVLHMDFPEEEALRFLMVGLLCVQETVKLRPSMSTTVKMLTNENHIKDVQISQPGLLSDLMDIRLRQKHSSQRTQTTFSRGSTTTSTHSTSYF